MINLKIERIKSGYTQKDIAQVLGIHKNYYSMIETGTRKPGFKLAKKIADTFGKTVDEIFFEHTHNKVLGDKDLA
ncbi:MAG: helix-turn-helix transcriptional regulator [Tepidibacter sp.]|jgi:putative transcriptional regulator|uniref:helix-turn-helix transcriptional regulator n=1 Tax=Tepidibacter sp. TaxID=2529387 RepID=UPI0025F0F5F9|nr:helix-turn-helix transcriptional regulator [Tepidibacter sp.]MCT4507902.1 helix-turn-helix transcriptional regulator [Tepidibacter sp.]MCT4606877.1 helix-turn-helix transcriptional regulator [Marinisporobacter sp.]